MFGPHWDNENGATGTQNTLGPLGSSFDEFYMD